MVFAFRCPSLWLYLFEGKVELRRQLCLIQRELYTILERSFYGALPEGKLYGAVRSGGRSRAVSPCSEMSDTRAAMHPLAGD